jgi:ketosteroid isomerase-like protein
MMRRHTAGTLASLGTAALAVLLATRVLDAHDFWVVPNAFAFGEGAMMEIRGQTGTRFPTSVSAVTPDRIADARVISASSDERIADLSVSDKSLLIRHKPSTPGQRVVAVALAARTTRTTAASLKRYIALEGNPDLAERYDREGAYGKADSITQRASKYAKTIVEVGRAGPRAFERQAGHLLEFVPIDDPTALREGGSVRMRLLFRGRPVSSAHLHAGAAPQEAGDTARRDISVVTDTNGIGTVPLGRGGLWNVRTLHASPAPASGEWDVAFATLVFQVAPSDPGSSRTPSDSTDVVATVERYVNALSRGDSATALALLAADAVIVESGGIESREQYRSHHLPADIAFARGVPSVHSARRAVVRGDAAWVTSTSTTRGEFRGRQVNSTGAELMILSRESDGWKIRAIHWSSRNRTPQ